MRGVVGRAGRFVSPVLAVATAEGVVVSAVQKPDGDKADCSQDPAVQLAEDNPAVVAAIAAGVNLVAGTSWLWARP
jgi:hypothetical protein